MYIPFSSLISEMDTKKLARIFIKNALDIEAYSNSFEKFFSNFSRRPKVRVVVKNIVELFNNLDDNKLQRVFDGLNSTFNLSFTKDNFSDEVNRLVCENFPLKSDEAKIQRQKAMRLAKFLKDLLSIALDDSVNAVFSSANAVLTAEEE